MTKLLDLFRSGMDTLQISQHLGGVVAGWDEGRVYNQIAKERNNETLLNTSGFPVALAPKTSPHKPLVKYVGHDGSRSWSWQ